MKDYAENGYYLSGRVTHSNPGWQHRRRQSRSRSDLIIAYSGTLHIYENDRKYDVKEGEFLFLQQNAPSGGYHPSPGAVEFYYVLFDGDVPSDMPKHAKLTDLTRPRMLFELMEHYNSMPEIPRGVLSNLVQVLFCDIRMQCENQIFSGTTVVDSVRAWIVRNRARALTVSDIAHHFGYSAEHLSRLFSHEYGMSLKSFISDKRLDFIDSLLADMRYTESDISAMADFTSENQLAKYYKYHRGITPAQARKNLLQNL